MERFWTLKYLEQQGITELEATVFKEGPGGSGCATTSCRWCSRCWARRGCRAAPGARAPGRGRRDCAGRDGTVIERLDAAPP
jgi:hypothetical protein